MAKIQFGGKITASHQTVTDAASEVIRVAMGMAEVTKISLGIIKNIGGGRRSVKCTPVPAGIKVAVRGNGSVQEIFIYTNSPEIVEASLKNLYR